MCVTELQTKYPGPLGNWLQGLSALIFQLLYNHQLNIGEKKTKKILDKCKRIEILVVSEARQTEGI